MQKCPICRKGRLIKKKVSYDFLRKNICRFEAEVCSNCREQIFDEENSKQILSRIKRQVFNKP